MFKNINKVYDDVIVESLLLLLLLLLLVLRAPPIRANIVVMDNWRPVLKQ